MTSVDSERVRFGSPCKTAHIVCSTIARDADAITCWSCCNGVFRRFRSRERPAPPPCAVRHSHYRKTEGLIVGAGSVRRSGSGDRALVVLHISGTGSRTEGEPGRG